MLAALAVLALSVISLSNASAQFQRHALIEEGTGVWCGYCPYGAFTIDSMVAAMGDNLVAISWHGPIGAPYSEPLGTHAQDTIASFDNVTGYPWASPGRTEAMCGAYEQGGQLDWPNPWYTIAESQALEAPLVDFRVVNAVYSSHAVDFDLDITPFDLSQMPTEDTAKYLTVAVLTEDGIVESQHIYDDPNETDISDFRHENVARAVGGKVLGDLFTIKTAKTWPIRKHYHIAVNTSLWNADSIRIKAFAVFKGNKSTFETYLDAGQTGYITKLPSTAPPAIWPILPAKDASISGDSIEIPIVWAAGGGVSSAALDYSIDGGTTWLSIVASTSASPYEWQLPDTAYGHQVMVRASNPSNLAITSIGPAFSIAPKTPAIITVSSPMANDSLLVGTTHAVAFSVSGPVSESSLLLEYSTDSMATWNTIATIANKTSYNWVIPEAPSMTAFARVTDAKGVVGESGMFSILDSGTVTNVTVGGAPNLPPATPETISWNVTGYLGESVNLDYLDPATQQYQTIAHGLSAAITSYDWTSVPSTEQSGYIIRVKYASGAMGSSAPFSISASGVTPNVADAGMSVVPDPVAATSSLRFSLDAGANVTLVVRDQLGREIVRIPEGMLAAGNHEITLDGTKLAAGAYEYQLLAGSKSTLGKFSVVR